MFNIPGETVAIIGPKGIPKEFPGTSGVEFYVERKSLELTNKGKTVRCYIRRWASTNNAKSYQGIDRVIIPSINTVFFDTISYSLLASIHASFGNATTVWYQGIGPAFFSFIPKLFHKKIYTTIHSLDWKRKKWGLFAQFFLRLCEIATIRFSDKVFVVSKKLQIYYTDTYHVHPILDKYKNPKSPSVPFDQARRKYSLTKNKYILYLGRFVPEKRIEWLIHACSDIKGLTVVLAGGSSHSDKYVSYLKSLGKEINIRYTGYVFGREKAELLSNCKLFVLPSMLEGYPVAVTEALGYGKKCLVGDFLKSEYPTENKTIHYFNTYSYDNFLLKLKRLIKE